MSVLGLQNAHFAAALRAADDPTGVLCRDFEMIGPAGFVADFYKISEHSQRNQRPPTRRKCPPVKEESVRSLQSTSVGLLGLGDRHSITVDLSDRLAHAGESE